MANEAYETVDQRLRRVQGKIADHRDSLSLASAIADLVRLVAGLYAQLHRSDPDTRDGSNWSDWNV